MTVVKLVLLYAAVAWVMSLAERGAVRLWRAMRGGDHGQAQ